MDVVKFICVAAMVFIHAHIVLITDSYRIADTSGFFYTITDKLMFLGLFLTVLIALAGFIFRLNGDYEIKKTIKLAVFISFLGFFMNMATWGAGYTFSWNVLQLVGLSFVVIAILMKFFSVGKIFLLSSTVVLTAGPLRNLLSAFNNKYLINIFIGADNHFIFWPFFPWFGVVGFGFLFAHYQLKYKNSVKFRINAAVIGLGLMAIAFLRGEISPALDPNYVWSPSIFQPKIGWVLATIGFFCVLVVLGNSLFSKMSFKKYGIINSYSKGILWIYVTQMFVSSFLSFFIKEFFPMDKPSTAYFILPVFMLLFSWYVGALSIKLFQEKKLVIALKKI